MLLDNVLYIYLISVGISNLFVKLFPVEYQEIIPGFYNPTFGCNCSGSVNIVSGHHSDRDTGSLTFLDRIRDFIPHGVLEKQEQGLTTKLSTGSG